MKVTEYIGSQFGNPRGLAGKICCVIMNMFNKKLYGKVSDTVLKRSGKNILDVGVGNGYLEKILSGKSDVAVTGIDISEDMIKNASKRNHAAVQQGRVVFALGDCCDLQFPDGTFDAVTSINTTYFWSDTIKGLSEIRRVLKDDGIFVNAVYSQEWLKRVSYTKKGFKFFSKKDYVSDGKKAGFSDVIIEDIVKGKSFTITYMKKPKSHE
jgi:ubiquinone/menaquinone biosynthesis C-methylase UbiE